MGKEGAAPGWAAGFLRGLGRTGNVSLAAREAGVARSWLYARRGRDPVLAGAWDAAIEGVRLRLAASGGALGGGLAAGAATVGAEAGRRSGGRKGSDELVRWRSKAGAQLTRARPGMLTASAAARFLAALRSCCNVTLACEVAKVRRGTVYRQRRKCAHFAEGWEEALADAYRRLELASVEAAAAVMEGQAPDPARFGGMNAAVALGLLNYHRRKMEARRGGGRGAVPARPSAEEVRASILKRLDAMAAAEGEGQGQGQGDA